MNAKQLRLFELVLVLSIAFLPSIIKSLVFISFDHISDFRHFGSVDYIVWIFQGLLSIALLFYVLYKNNRSYTEIGLSLKFNWKDLFTAVGLMFLAFFINAILAGVINTFLLIL